jgi:pimeloyl-ACP methyl ester carboxylesterase
MKALPAKQKVQIQGSTMEYITSGSGLPVIVLVNGAGGPVEGWYKVYSELEALSTVFAYNRLGIGGSDRPNSPQTGDVIVSDLRDLLVVADLQPAYVLVGHSLGGFYVNLFARQFPDEVAGVVMLDAAAPGDEILQHEYQTKLQTILNKFFGLFDAIFSKDENGEVNFVPETIAQINSAGPFPDIPLVVVSGGKRPPALLMSTEAFEHRAKNQKSLVALSQYGEQVIASKSGHFPQFAEPELVVKVIRQILDSVRTQ